VLYLSIRILPHKQNSGGFFVAVLRKKYALRDPQNSSKLCATVNESTTVECSAVTSQPPVVASSDSVVASDTCSQVKSGEEQDRIIASDAETSQQPVAINSIRSGWFGINLTLE